MAWVDDAFMANSAATGATQLQLPAAWNIYAGIQHYWVPNLRTSLYGGYVNYRAESSAVDALVLRAERIWPRLRGLGGLADRIAHVVESDQKSRRRR